MLKRALIFLPIFMSFLAGDLCGQVNNADTIKKIDIRVTVTAKSKDVDTTSSFKNIKKASSHKKAKSSYPVTKTTPKKKPSIKKLDHYKVLDSNIIINSNTPPKGSLRDTTPALKQNEYARSTQQSNSKRNNYFLSSLILIITGTLLAVFFRSGIPLIIAILLLVTGYYILIYSLLFMT